MWLAYPRGSLKASLPCPHADLVLEKSCGPAPPHAMGGHGAQACPIVCACFQAHLFPGRGRLGWCGSMRATPSGGVPSLLLGRKIYPVALTMGTGDCPVAPHSRQRGAAGQRVLYAHFMHACIHAGRSSARRCRRRRRRRCARGRWPAGCH